jgi:hypothetical protein
MAKQQKKRNLALGAVGLAGTVGLGLLAKKRLAKKAVTEAVRSSNTLTGRDTLSLPPARDRRSKQLQLPFPPRTLVTEAKVSRKALPPGKNNTGLDSYNKNVGKLAQTKKKSSAEQAMRDALPGLESAGKRKAKSERTKSRLKKWDARLASTPVTAELISSKRKGSSLKDSAIKTQLSDSLDSMSKKKGMSDLNKRRATVLATMGKYNPENLRQIRRGELIKQKAITKKLMAEGNYSSPLLLSDF